MRTIEDIRAATAKTREAASKTLTPDQAALVEALADEADAREAEAAEAAKLRGLDMAERVDKARVAAAGGYLVAGVDLVGLFPLGALDALPPCGGVIVIRSPDIATSDAFAANAEAMKSGLSALAIRLVCDCVVDPAKTDPDGTRLLGWLQKFPEAAGTIAMRAKELGGAQAKATKRGRG